MIKKNVLSILITICLVTCFSMYYVHVNISISNSKKLNSNLIIDKENSTLNSNSDEIKILQLTDLQFSSLPDAALALSGAKRIIIKANPDLIVLTGDNVFNYSGKKHLKILIDFMDSFAIPCAVVYGNHDYGSFVSIEDQNKLYENSEYCIFKKGSLKNSSGNYHYNIKRNDEVMASLIFMDSGKNGFNEAHVKWYENVVASINNVTSLLFFHIPLEETKIAYEKYLSDNKDIDGLNLEGIHHQKTNVWLFEKVKELGSTKVIAYGHDHLNNLILDYEGVSLCYGLKMGKASYFTNKLQGGNLYTVNIEGKIDIERIYEK